MSLDGREFQSRVTAFLKLNWFIVDFTLSPSSGELFFLGVGGGSLYKKTIQVNYSLNCIMLQ